MKLSEWARKNSINYNTAWGYFRDGLIPNARQLPTGTIVIDEDGMVPMTSHKDNPVDITFHIPAKMMAKFLYLASVNQELVDNIGYEMIRKYIEKHRELLADYNKLFEK